MVPCYFPSTKQGVQFCIRSATSASATGVILQAVQHCVHASSFTGLEFLEPFYVSRQGLNASASLWLVAVHLTNSILLADDSEQSCHFKNSAQCPNEVYFGGCGLVHFQRMSQCNLQDSCLWGGSLRVRFSNSQCPVPKEFLCS